MKNLFTLFALLILINPIYSQQYKEMMEDPSVNFYDVCHAAEIYFSTIDKEAKGSGWKGYQRWKNNNEYKYYPSGRRDNIDPYFAANQYNNFLKNNPPSAGKNSFSSGWEELGPATIDNISGHYAAGLGRIEAVYVNPANMDTIYVGSRSGGFWKSSNGGISWTGGSTDFLTATGVNTIAVRPTNAKHILINIKNARNSTTHGIYQSTDGGNNWALSNFNPTNLGTGGLGTNFNINIIAYHPTISNLVFVGTSSGLYRSTNDLSTFTEVITTGNFHQIDFHPTNPNYVYLTNSSNDDYLYYSSDQGLNFSTVLISGNGGKKAFLSTTADCPDCVFFASTNGVWKSTDKGLTFTFKSNPAESCLGFAVNDTDKDNMIYGYVDVEMSDNGGITFNQVTWWSLGNANHNGTDYLDKYLNSDAYVHADLHPAICVNGVFYVGTDGLISKSTDGGSSWQNIGQGIATRENYKLGISQSNHYRSVSGSQDNGTSIKKEDGWLEFYGADGMECLIHPLNDDWMIGSFQYGGRRRTKDGGITQSGVNPPEYKGNWEAPITYDPLNPMRLYNFNDTIMLSEDFGSSWSYRGEPSSFTGDIQQSAIAENNSNIIVISRSADIDKSIDGGLNFISIKNNLPASGTIKDIAFHPNNDDVIIVVYAAWQADNNKVFITFNGGTSWNNITYNLGSMPIHSVVIDHTADENIYLGAEIGLFTKPMAGTSWTLYNTTLPNVTIEEMEINYGSNTLKAATWGRGLWEYTLVGRNDFPSIMNTSITTPPTETAPAEGVDQWVTSIITSDQSITSAFIKWSANDLSLSQSISMVHISDSTWLSQTALPNNPVGTKMYFKVFAVGISGDTSETYRFMYEVKEFGYCDAQGSGTGSDFITNVSLNGMNSNSVYDSYTYYGNRPITLLKDSTYTISMKLQYHFPNDKAGAWIDFNRDGIFSDPESLNMSAFDASHISTGTFTVPSAAIVNDTLRLRVVDRYWSSIVSPCGSDAGEVEDYPVFIPAVGINSTAFLGAAYDVNTGLMWDSLRYHPKTKISYIPRLEPYTALATFTHIGGGGGEYIKDSAKVYNLTGNDAIVDWVFIELRDKNDHSAVLHTRSALIQRDGDIVDVDGYSPLNFSGLWDTDFYISLRHRNHLGIMTKYVKTLIPEAVRLDFSDTVALFDFGNSHPIAGSGFDFSKLATDTLDDGSRIMWSGDANGDGKIKYQAPNDDIFTIFSNILLHPSNSLFNYNFNDGYGYYSGDINLDGKVKLQAPGDDSFKIFSQVLLYPLNTLFNYNFDVMFEQLP